MVRVITIILCAAAGAFIVGCGTSSPPPADAGAQCSDNAQCDDGVFCNGPEVCNPALDSAGPDGCAPAIFSPCEEGQLCDELAGQCITDCDVTRDADGDGWEAVECGGTDCDDMDANRFPGNVEICDVNAHDEDCDPLTYGFRDQDDDGLGDARCCNEDPETELLVCGRDCDDTDDSTRPGQVEICDDFDNDCDGRTDEGVLLVYFADTDGDGFGDASAATVEACVTPVGYVEDNSDCDDTLAARNPSATEVCDSLDNDCDGGTDERVLRRVYPDTDGDTFGDANVVPMEVCEIPSGYVDNNGDCDDTNQARHRAALEVCDEIDNNCNGVTDEGVGATFYADTDGDGYGADDAAPVFSCESQLEGHSLNNSDCDDTNRQVSPVGVELCDLLDNDCNGTVDDGLQRNYWPDTDGDGFGDMTATPTFGCAQEGFVTNGSDCDDSERNANPAAIEICDGIDNNCVGGVDEGLTGTYYPDVDGDGFGDRDVTGVVQCPAPNFSLDNTDCDDGNRNTYPGATEICDLEDNDCDPDGQIDEGTTEVPWYEDDDMDGFGDSTSVPVLSCSPVAGRSQLIDCDDTNPDVYPGAPQLCDRVQNDCSLANGGGVLTSEDEDNDGHSPFAAACEGGFSRDDCNDESALAFTGNTEVCDGVDNDCSAQGLADPSEDADGDFHSPEGAACTGGYPRDDCDDTRPEVYLDAPELCDRLDTDCRDSKGDAPEEDEDRDGHAPSFAICSGGFPRDDCDDVRPDAYLGATELCNLLDDDCSSGGGADMSEDADGDGFAAFDAACTGGDLPRTDCDDALAEHYLCELNAVDVVTSGALDGNDWLTAADLNYDGFVDLLSREPGNDGEAVTNDGDGTFTLGDDRLGYYRVYPANVDGAGPQDFVSLHSDEVRYWTDATASTLLAMARSLTGVAVGDVNGDGLDDVLVTSSGLVLTGTSGNAHLYLNEGGSFVMVPISFGNTEHVYNHPIIADLNGDGDLDLVFTRRTGSLEDEITWARGRGDGSFEGLAPVESRGPWTFLASADTDGDGRAEIFGIRRSEVYAFEWDGSAFDRVDALEFLLRDVEPVPYAARGADIDDDGDDDLLYIHGAGRELRLLENLGAGSFRAWEINPSSRNDATEWAAADYDADGSLDVAVSRSSNAPEVVLISGGAFGRDGQTSCICAVPAGTTP